MAEAPRVVVFTDRRTGDAFAMAVPPTSPWWALLDPVTEAEIRTPTAAERADDATYRDAGGLVIESRPATATARR